MAGLVHFHVQKWEREARALPWLTCLCVMSRLVVLPFSFALSGFRAQQNQVGK